MDNMKRINIRIPVEVYDYYKDRSKKTGLPMSVLIYMDLKNYRMIEDVNNNLTRALKMMDKDKDNKQTENAEG